MRNCARRPERADDSGHSGVLRRQEHIASSSDYQKNEEVRGWFGRST
jgi:hypothetical protein